MSYLEAIALALVQAFTEFLPVSSSGHLVLAQTWLGAAGEVDLAFDILLHVATAAAVVVYLRRDLLTLLRGAAGTPGSGAFAGCERHLLGAVVVATIPTGLIGLGIEHWLADLIVRPGVVGVMLLVTGAVLMTVRGRAPTRTGLPLSWPEALAIGVLQGLAVFPGISRSGVTIAGAILLGVERTVAARFSLLISLPAIAGACVLAVRDLAGAPPAPGPYVAGVVVAAVAGYGAIEVLMRVVRRDRFHRFAYYVWALGAVAVAAAWCG